MRKIVLTLAAIAAVGLALPVTSNSASAETVVIKKTHRDWHPMRHRDRVVIREGQPIDAIFVNLEGPDPPAVVDVPLLLPVGELVEVPLGGLEMVRPKEHAFVPVHRVCGHASPPPPGRPGCQQITGADRGRQCAARQAMHPN